MMARQSGRIAAVLHDDVSQVLAAVHMTNPRLRAQVTGDRGSGACHACRGQAAGVSPPDISKFAIDAYVNGESAADDKLSWREREVLQLVAEGKASKEIAEVLGVSAKTAESYRAPSLAWCATSSAPEWCTPSRITSDQPAADLRAIFVPPEPANHENPERRPARPIGCQTDA